MSFIFLPRKWVQLQRPPGNRFPGKRIHDIPCKAGKGNTVSGQMVPHNKKPACLFFLPGKKAQQFPILQGKGDRCLLPDYLLPVILLLHPTDMDILFCTGFIKSTSVTFQQDSALQHFVLFACRFHGCFQIRPGYLSVNYRHDRNLDAWRKQMGSFFSDLSFHGQTPCILRLTVPGFPPAAAGWYWLPQWLQFRG